MSAVSVASDRRTKPRLGFLGLGWIGLHRLQAIADADFAQVVALADPVPESLSKARDVTGCACTADDFDELLACDLDGIVIATPSALHAEQAIRALRAGAAVFCQKPLGRNANETRAVVDAARTANRLLGVDLSYRFLEASRRLREWVQAGELGRVFAVQATFHNGYGPGKLWFYERTLSGGGCLLDLGIHLLDLVLWIMDWPEATPLAARFFHKGQPLPANSNLVEDFAAAQLELEGGALCTLACSWDLPLGCDAEIELKCFGSLGGAALKNVHGSFFDFSLERYHGTKTRTFDAADRSWFGAAALDWARRLQLGERFDPHSAHLIDVAATLDAIYAQGGITP